MFVVVGGGVTGLFSALYLRAEGADVLVFDPAPGAWSRAAAGVLEPTKFEINRINVRGYPIRYLKMWLKGKARVTRLDWRWILAYLKVYGRDYSPDVWSYVKELAFFSLSTYRRLAEAKNDFEYREEPLYEIVEDVEEEAKALKADPLSPRFEIGEVGGKAAIVYLDAAVISTDLAAERLYREAEEAGVKFIKRRVVSVSENGVLAEGGHTVKADGVIVAGGWWARELGVPIAPMKGYGFRVKTAARLGRTIADFVSGVFLVPFRDWVKITGRFDFDPTDDYTPSSAVLDAARAWIRDFSVVDMAVGYRPCSPDGLPVIEKRGQVVIATGGCRLGWTLGPGIAKAAVDLALGRTPSTPLTTMRFKE
ncbi:MAG: FAD-dependent oxidoreductase [Pyrobaculum sp.]|uniref:FAD-dependent oxidoreductase n=1 Tax=Pyrobaculum sp. TaxID=2004705 RepID=UPI003160D5D3